MRKIRTKMGDGTPVALSQKELMQDLEDGTREASENGEIDALTKEELQHLYDIFASPYRFVSVEPGKEIVLTYDGPEIKLRRLEVNINRVQALQVYEKLLGADTVELGHVDYSYKQAKMVVGFEQPDMEQACLILTVPVLYGSMPNLGLYSQPDGPFPNPSELLPMGKIDEARASLEGAIEHAVEDMVYVASAMYEAGADGINFDTIGAAGDADFMAALKATEILKKKYPQICIELGTAGEFIIGMHSELYYDGTRLAGLYPHQMVKLAQKAGGTIFGPVCNTDTNMSSPWNAAKAITLMKACGEAAEIPIHVNMGMGVGAVPVSDFPPIDIVSRVSKAMVEICRLDGL